MSSSVQRITARQHYRHTFGATLIQTRLVRIGPVVSPFAIRLSHSISDSPNILQARVKSTDNVCPPFLPQIFLFLVMFRVTVQTRTSVPGDRRPDTRMMTRVNRHRSAEKKGGEPAP